MAGSAKKVFKKTCQPNRKKQGQTVNELLQESSAVSL
jgi:hypothetical protein